MPEQPRFLDPDLVLVPDLGLGLDLVPDLGLGLDLVPDLGPDPVRFLGLK